MNYESQHPPDAAPDRDDAGAIVNWQGLRNWGAFSLRAVARRRRLVLGVAVLTFLLAALVVAAIPKKYHVATTLLAQKNLVLALPGEEGNGQAPTGAVVETITSRESLEAIVAETNLVEEWAARRAPHLKFKDWVMSAFRREPTEAERIDGFVKYLQKKLQVYTDNAAGVVTIEIYWPDPQMAYRLVDAARRGFLEARHVHETSAIAEQASILEGHAAELGHQIDIAVGEIQALRERKRSDLEKAVGAKKSSAAESSAPRAPIASAPASAQEPVNDGAVRRRSELSVMIEAKRRAMHELEEFRRRRLAELQGELESRRAAYTDVHPAIVDLKHAIVAAGRESPQVGKLRADLQKLEAEYQSLGGAKTGDRASRPRSGGSWSSAGSSRKGLSGDVIRIEQQPAEERDPEIEYARSKLRFSIQGYQQLEERIQRARIDLDTAEAAFKYRYVMVRPPELPKGPISPKVPLILLAAGFAGVFLGIFSAVALDLRRGLFQESWQVETFLALPVLASVTEPEEAAGT